MWENVISRFIINELITLADVSLAEIFCDVEVMYSHVLSERDLHRR